MNVLFSAMLVIVAIWCTGTLTIAATVPSVGDSSDTNNPEYWRHRRIEFYRNTAFDLSEDNLRLLGRFRTNFENKSTLPRGHLPFWFDYELFKKVFNKAPSPDAAEELKRHHAYINTCMRAIKTRTLFRMLAGTEDTQITADADRFFSEKYEQFHKNSPSPSVAEDEIYIKADVSLEPDVPAVSDEKPVDRAIRLMKQEMNFVESKNQVETYLRAFNEIDGSALAGKLPY